MNSGSLVQPTVSVTLPPAVVEALVAQVTERVLERFRPEPATSPYLTAAEAAEYLRCRSVQRIYDLSSAGLLHPLKEGRRSLYLRADLDALLQSSWPRRGPT
jgi:hypothetical protein